MRVVESYPCLKITAIEGILIAINKLMLFNLQKQNEVLFRGSGVEQLLGIKKNVVYSPTPTPHTQKEDLPSYLVLCEHFINING